MDKNTNTTFDIPKKIITSSSQPDFLPKSRILILLITIVLMTILLASRFIWKPVLEVNQVVNRNIYATTDFKYEDEKATQRAINEVMNSISPSPKKNMSITEQELSELNELIQQISDVKQLTQDDAFFDTGIISTDVQNYIYSLNQITWQKNIYTPSVEVISTLMAGGYPEDASRNQISKALEKLLPSNTDKIERKAITQIITGAISPDRNIYYAAMQRDSAREEDIKNDLNKKYQKLINKNISNKSLFDEAIIRPVINERQIIQDTFAYIYRELEKIQGVKRLNKLVYNILPENIRANVSKLTIPEWLETKSLTLNTFQEILDDGITRMDMDNLENKIDTYLPDNLKQEQRELVYDLITSIARPNVIINQEEFLALQKEAATRVEPIYISVNKGSLLVKKGEILSEEKLKILDAAGVLNKQINWNGVSEIFSLVTISVFIYMLYIYFFEKEVLLSSTYLWLISLLLLAIIAISDLVVSSNPQFIPLAVFTAVVAMFINIRIAIVSLILIVVLFNRIYDITFVTFFTIICGCLTAAFIFPKVNQRINILKCGIIIALIQVIAYNVATIATDVSATLSSQISRPDYMSESFLWLLSGIIFSMVILAILPLVEEFFGLITYSRLTELGDFNQPVLRELEEKAPGTFQHSIAVAALSEYAARKLNLDSTLTRVGSYYHDLGKMLKPEFFIENQFEQTNPHDILDNPEKSARIIISHARAGLSVARKHKVHQSIIPFITEHHGTSLVSYFYYKAKQSAKTGETVPENHFRYFGPKPQSKETAIVMLADSAEAAVRTIKEKNRESIKSKIKDIVSGKINDGQLNESGLTTDEIAIIIDAFTYVILEFYHNRIEYPSMKK
jgi:putative nucleotidyltransferase with HDIG domain